jgi:hypothetical protein
MAAALGGGLVLGWLTAVTPRTPTESENAAGASPRHGGVAAGAAGERLSALNYAAAAEVYVEEAPPPPPDVAVLFRRDLTAIEQTPSGPIAWIVDLNQMAGRRGLRRGDIYQDGWRVSAIREQVIELRRRREVRRVETFVPPPEFAP